MSESLKQQPRGQNSYNILGTAERVLKSTVFFFNFRKQRNFTVGWHLSSSTIMFPSASSLTRGATVVVASASSTPCISLLFCCWSVLVGDPLSASWLIVVLVSPAGSLFLKWIDETLWLSLSNISIDSCHRSHKLLNNRLFQVFKKVMMRIIWWKSVDTLKRVT